MIIAASNDHSYTVSLSVPDQGGVLIQRGLELPVTESSASAPKVDVSIRVTRPVKIQIVPLRSQDVQGDIYGESVPV